MNPKTDPFSPEFDWIEFLESMISGTASISDEQQTKLVSRSQNWVTCACGQLCTDLPRKRSGAPWDRYLFRLGASFFEYISSGDWASAMAILHHIETRTAYLLGATDPCGADRRRS